MKYKPRKVLSWIAVNLAVLALAVYGIWFDVVWAGNLFKFVLWFTVIIYAICCHGKAVKNQKLLESLPQKTVPSSVSVTADIALILLLAAAGWWFYTVLQILQAYLFAYLMHRDEPQEDQDEVAILLGEKK